MERKALVSCGAYNVALTQKNRFYEEKRVDRQHFPDNKQTQ